MENEFVTYEQAISLNELGCGVIMNYKHWKVGKNILVFHNNYNMQFIIDRGFDVECLNVYAPLKQQVFRWFREKYNIQGYIYSSTVRGNKEGTKQFTGYVWNINGIDMPFISTDPRDELHDTYEEAENACIDKLIEIAKQQDNGN